MLEEFNARYCQLKSILRKHLAVSERNKFLKSDSLHFKWYFRIINGGLAHLARALRWQ